MIKIQIDINDRSCSFLREYLENPDCVKHHIFCFDPILRLLFLRPRVRGSAQIKNFYIQVLYPQLKHSAALASLYHF